jgi:prevent-host-death family protein
MTMQVMTARDAKTRFGEALDTMQREPILITKNSRPVGVMVSLDDLKGTYLADLFIEKEEGYDAWVASKVGASMERLKAEGSKGRSADETHASVMDKVRLRLNSKK